LREIRF